jgi:hypothetical protein
MQTLQGSVDNWYEFIVGLSKEMNYQFGLLKKV